MLSIGPEYPTSGILLTEGSARLADSMPELDHFQGEGAFSRMDLKIATAGPELYEIWGHKPFTDA